MMTPRSKPAPRRSRAAGSKRRRVLVVDDHPIVRRGLAQLVKQEQDLTICGEASNATEALAMVPEAKPNIVLVDISLEGTNGIELTKTLHQRHPDLPVLVLSMHDEVLYAERALRAGAKGYLMKGVSGNRLVTGIRDALRGRMVVSRETAAHLRRNLVKRPLNRGRGRAFSPTAWPRRRPWP